MREAPADTTRWVGLHVYYRTGQDDLILDAVQPLVAGLTAAERLERFFFLRYWKGGMHIRLRLQARPGHTAAVMAQARAHLEEHVRRRPSRLQVTVKGHVSALRTLAALENEEPHDEIVPDNTVLVEDYQPEYAKYGGPAGVALAEEVFHHSSLAVLHTLRSVRGNQARRLGLGYRMMLRALRAAGLSHRDGADFLDRYTRYWRRYAPREVDWEELLARQESVLRLQAGCEPVPDASLERAISRWTQELARTLALTPALRPSGRSETGWRDFLLVNHVHTHNNRLGIVPAREAYLAFLGSRVLRGPDTAGAFADKEGENA